MICYRDMTFCVSAGCRNKCGRRLEITDRQRAEKMGLPIAQGYFCDENGELLNGNALKEEKPDA